MLADADSLGGTGCAVVYAASGRGQNRNAISFLDLTGDTFAVSPRRTNVNGYLRADPGQANRRGAGRARPRPPHWAPPRIGRDLLKKPLYVRLTETWRHSRAEQPPVPKLSGTLVADGGHYLCFGETCRNRPDDLPRVVAAVRPCCPSGRHHLFDAPPVGYAVPPGSTLGIGTYRKGRRQRAGLLVT